MLNLSKSVYSYVSRKGGVFATTKFIYKVVQRIGILAFLKLCVEKYNKNELFRKGIDRNNYSVWLSKYEKKIKSNYKSLLKIPNVVRDGDIKFSVVLPVYKVKLQFLKQAVESVIAQTYTNWELCIVDDFSDSEEISHYLNSLKIGYPNIKISANDVNSHISHTTNVAISMANGQYIAFLDHDDLLDKDALLFMYGFIMLNNSPPLLYSDEDKLDQSGNRITPYFKPDFNYELMLAQNMICHLVVVRKDIVDATSGLKLGFEGAQDHDFLLRAIELIDHNEIVHVPLVLYHWRIHEQSTSMGVDIKSYSVEAGRRAVEEHLLRLGRKARVSHSQSALGYYKVRYEIPSEIPKVCIVIPTKDRIDLLSQCINSIIEKTTYKNYEIIIVNNRSDHKETIEYFRKVQKIPNIRIIDFDFDFNYSAINNFAASQAVCDYLCLMNNDIEVIEPEWLEEMLSFALQKDIGCVGAKLLYPDDTVQHAGIVLGIGGVAGHPFKHQHKDSGGYFGRALVHHECSAVTAACLVIKKEIFDKVDGLSEDLAVAFNDVDFCLKVKSMGYRNIMNPSALLYHHESASRGYEDSPEKIKRFNFEGGYILSKWSHMVKDDRNYSPMLTLDSEDFSLIWPPRGC